MKRKRAIYLAGLLAILAAIFFSPLEMKWPRDLLLPIVLVWAGLCCLAGGFMKNASREYERKVGLLWVLLGGTLIAVYLLPVKIMLKIILVLAVGIPVVIAGRKAGKIEKQRVKKD